MTHDQVQQSLDRFITAWRSGDSEAIGELYSADASYGYRGIGVPQEVTEQGSDRDQSANPPTNAGWEDGPDETTAGPNPSWGMTGQETRKAPNRNELARSFHRPSSSIRRPS